MVSWYAPNRFESYGEEEIKAVEECLRDGWLAGFGKRTVEFEERVAKLFGKKYGTFVNRVETLYMLESFFDGILSFQKIGLAPKNSTS